MPCDCRAIATACIASNTSSSFVWSRKSSHKLPDWVATLHCSTQGRRRATQALPRAALSCWTGVSWSASISHKNLVRKSSRSVTRRSLHGSPTMSIIVDLSAIALRQVVPAALKAVGVEVGGEAVARFLLERFVDQSQALTKALQTTNERAWKPMEVALAGESWWD